jgi:hypothetical protein
MAVCSLSIPQAKGSILAIVTPSLDLWLAGPSPPRRPLRSIARVHGLGRSRDVPVVAGHCGINLYVYINKRITRTREATIADSVISLCNKEPTSSSSAFALFLVELPGSDGGEGSSG